MIWETIVPTGIEDALPNSTPTPYAHLVPNIFVEYHSHPARNEMIAPATTANQLTPLVSSVLS